MSLEAIENLEDLTPKERKLFESCGKIFSQLLRELKNKKLLKKRLELPVNHIYVIETTRRFKKAYNMFMDIFKERGKSARFVKHNKEFGITMEDLPYLFLTHVISALIISSELFRNNMLTILKLKKPFNAKMGLGALLTELENVSPRYGGKVKKLLDSKLRNALVHGTFWVSGNQIYCCDDMTLLKPTIVPLDKLMIEVKRNNIISTCLFSLMVEHYKSATDTSP